MTISNEHLAELLSGIARAQQAIVDAVERADGGWRNTHLIPLLTVAANMRASDARLLDLPSRILLRYQGRVPPDSASIVADLERLLALPPAAVTAADPTAPPPLPPAVARAAAKAAAAAGAAAPAAAPAAPRPAAAAPAPTARPAAAPAAGAADENLDFSKPS